jgi:hypothetical protein
MGLGQAIIASIIHMDLHKPNNKLVNAQLEHLWCTDKPRTNINSENSPRPVLKGSRTFPFILYFMPGHMSNTQMSFCFRTPKCELWNSQNFDFRNFAGP